MPTAAMLHRRGACCIACQSLFLAPLDGILCACWAGGGWYCCCSVCHNPLAQLVAPRSSQTKASIDMSALAGLIVASPSLPFEPDRTSNLHLVQQRLRYGCCNPCATGVGGQTVLQRSSATARTPAASSCALWTVRGGPEGGGAHKHAFP
jgi:hypothetical protein